ncbi:MAG: pyrroline-5-carboxylate reductase [Anaerolineae bacterium]|nr:pyrroline-5-carboxylate reductase [Anaerolineae bacterium]
MEQSPSIAIIGGGVMGEAILSGVLHKQLTRSDCVFVADPIAERGRELAERYSITSFTDAIKAVEKIKDLVILSVKPQQLEVVFKTLNALVISIVAGATVELVSTGLNHDSVVRAMPNTPAQIGEGITVWYPSRAVRPDQIELARQVLSAMGQEVEVNEEIYMDMATALSGTGPAYAFMFMEAMIDAGVHLGFSRKVSEQLVLQTLSGSVDYYRHKKVHPAQLRNEVTSPGGTTAAALYHLERMGFRTAISRAIWAAYERSQELGRGKKVKDPEKNND